MNKAVQINGIYHNFYCEPDKVTKILFFNHDSFHYIHEVMEWDLSSYGNCLVAIFKIKYK